MIVSNKPIKRLLFTLLVIFIFLNIVAYVHAFRFTHFAAASVVKTKDGNQLSFRQKLGALFFGINNPRPQNKILPARAFETIRLKSNKEVECWFMKTKISKGTIILFHGYSGSKSAMLDQAEVFLNGGYNTLLVDFMGSGGSEGNQTTIGYYEAEEVKTAFDYVARQGEKNIILFGTSMGAVAIIKAQSDYQLAVRSIIVECPFGTMLQTVEARFKTMHFPAFPMARLLVFWGGFQNDFNAFAHDPVTYAKNISCPVLLLYGAKDEKVSKSETDAIFFNLKGVKVQRTYALAGHENYLLKYRREWTEDVLGFAAAN